jgi:hypothetical protein
VEYLLFLSKTQVNSITTFISQFPEEIQSTALNFITHLEIYDEDLLVNKIYDIVSELSQKQNSKIGLSYLGNQTDSGSIFPYRLRGKIDNDKIILSEISDSTINKCDIMVLYDDNINSGLQLINIFAELLDEKNNLPDDINLSESHISSLSEKNAKQKLKTMPKYFVFTIGFENIELELKEKMDTYFGISGDTIHVKLYKELKKDLKIFTGKDSIFDIENKIKLKKFIESKGEELLRKENKSENKINTCKLGYANAESMVVFPYNVPTMTITALWCRGENWIPLVPRRRRTNMQNELIGEEK